MSAAVLDRPAPATAASSASCVAAGTRSVRDDLVDAATLLALIGLGLVGFRSAFGGNGYLVAGLVGAVLGSVVWRLGRRLALGPLVTMGVGVLAFVVGGGPAVPEDAVAGFLPRPGTPAALFYGLVHGWADLLTTAPPVGMAAGAGVVPYVCGFVAGLGGTVLATRNDRALLPSVAPLVVLVLSAVFGTERPVSLVAQGSLLAVGAIGWGSVRSNRARRSVDGHVHWPRVLAGAGMLVAMAATATVIGPRLPGTSAQERFVARDHFAPPFDPRAYPSPLASYRAYIGSPEAREAVQFRVTDLPEGARVRLATMDSYDGVVWTSGGAGAPASGRFIRVGTAILPVPGGRVVDSTVTIADYSGVWVPSVGVTRSVSFGGPRADDQAESFRYNRTTGAAATPIGIAEGDSYRLDARIPPSSDGAGASADRDLGLGPTGAFDASMKRVLQDVVGSVAGDLARAERLEEWFHSGYYSDGDQGEDQKAAASAPGHSLRRMLDFLDKAQVTGKSGLVGNAEQYAATMALFARELGLPARVVMGFRQQEGKGGDVAFTGNDIDAWVEISFGGEWITFDPTPDRTDIPQDVQTEDEVVLPLAQQDPPPINALIPPEDEAQQGSKEDAPDRQRPPLPTDRASIPKAVLVAAGVLGAPVLLVGALAAVVLALKSRRTRRRRLSGTPAQRLAGAWQEAVDRARDMGVALPPRATRRETARALAVGRWTAAAPTAELIDAATFGPATPGEPDSAAAWSAVEAGLAEMRAPLGRRARMRAALSPRSLRRAV